VLLGSDSYIHWVGYWFNFGVLHMVFPCLLLHVYVQCPVVLYCCDIVAC
jgi:hypothetical protein